MTGLSCASRARRAVPVPALVTTGGGWPAAPSASRIERRRAERVAVAGPARVLVEQLDVALVRLHAREPQGRPTTRSRDQRDRRLRRLGSASPLPDVEVGEDA